MALNEGNAKYIFKPKIRSKVSQNVTVLVCSFIKVGLEISAALESNRIIINMGTYGTGIWYVMLYCLHFKYFLTNEDITDSVFSL